MKIANPLGIMTLSAVSEAREGWTRGTDRHAASLVKSYSKAVVIR